MSRRKKLHGEEAWKHAYEAMDLAPLQELLGVEISDRYLRLALTHSSFAHEAGNLPNNERLEFLGDAVLGLSVASALYELHPTRPESDISRMRASVVSGYSLARLARTLGVGHYVILGRGEQVSGGADKDSILADTMEALFGAVYLEHGFDVARGVVLRLCDSLVKNASTTAMYCDWKTTLQERLAEEKLPAPIYYALSEGLAHQRVFTVYAVVDGHLLGTARSDRNKKAAEQQAAAQACATLDSGIDAAPLFDVSAWQQDENHVPLKPKEIDMDIATAHASS